jgi:hypothetical protein
MFTGASGSDERLRLAQDDAQALKLENHRVVHNHVAPGLFIYLGLELEDLQCVFLSLFALLSEMYSDVRLPWIQLNWVQRQQVSSKQRFLSDRTHSGVALMHGLRFNTCIYHHWLQFARLLTKKAAGSRWLFMRSNFICHPGFIHLSFVIFIFWNTNGSFGMRRATAFSMIFADFYLWNQ